MSAARAIASVLTVIVAGALVGCGGGTTALPGPSQVTGRFAGRDDAGIGVAIDFGAYDATTQAIRAALDTPTAWSVGLVSIVNRSNHLQPIPALFVTRPSGRVQRLARATVMRRADTGAKVQITAPGPFVPEQGALSLYVVFRGRPSDVRRLEMRVGVGPIVELTPQRLSASAQGGRG